MAGPTPDPGHRSRSLAEGLRADQLPRGPTVDLQPSLRAAGRVGTFVSEDVPSTADYSSTRAGTTRADPGSFDYVEDFVRYQLSASLGGARGMVESALPFVAFTIAWLIGHELYPALIAAIGTALIAALVRLMQHQSLRFVATAIIPTAIAAFVASRTGRAEDVFLPGVLYNGALALLSLFTIAIRRPLVGFVLGAAVGDPTGWARDRGLVRMTTKLTLVLAVPYLLRFAVQLPLFLAGQVVLLGIAKVVLGWPLLIAALGVIGLMLAKGRTPIEASVLSDAAEKEAEEPARSD